MLCRCTLRSVPEAFFPSGALLGGGVVDESPIYALLTNSRYLIFGIRDCDVSWAVCLTTGSLLTTLLYSPFPNPARANVIGFEADFPPPT